MLTTGTLRLLAPLVALGSIGPAVASAESTGTHRLHELAPGVYAAEPLFGGATAAIIIDQEFVVVVDSHSSPAAATALADTLRTMTDTPVRFVVNTHWHVDHHAGNAAWRNAFADRVTFIAHDLTREDVPTLGRQQYRDTAPYRRSPVAAADRALAIGADPHGVPLDESDRAAVQKFRDAQASFAELDDDFEFTLPELTTARAMTLHGTTRRIEVLHVHRAHTRGDLVVYLPEEKILVAGDILTRPILWTWSAYPVDYVRTLRALEALEVEQIVIGHGGPVLEGTGYLVAVREALEVFVAFARAARQEGLAVDAAIDRAGTDAGIQALRYRFVAADGSEDGMFDQMVAWTVERAMLELSE